MSEEVTREPFSGPSPETLEKLGVDADWQEVETKETEEPETPTGDDDKGTSEKTTTQGEKPKGNDQKDGEETQEGEQSSSPSEEGEEGSDDKDGKDGEEDSSVENAEDGNEQDVDVLESVSSRINEMSDDERSQFHDDFRNWDKWTAKQTQRNQEIADQEREVKSFAEQVGFGPIRDAVKHLIESGEFDNVLDATDGYYEDLDESAYKEAGFEKNPLRTIFETLKNSVDTAETKVSEQTDNVIQQQIKEIQDADEKYKDETALQELYDLAIDRGVTLPVAHELKQGEGYKNEIANLQKQLDKLQTELKDRNEKLKQKRANESLTEINSGATGGKGSADQHSKHKPGDFDATEANVRKKLGLD